VLKALDNRSEVLASVKLRLNGTTTAPHWYDAEKITSAIIAVYGLADALELKTGAFWGIAERYRQVKP